MFKTILVKGMVCDRCIQTITQELNSIGIPIAEVQLGLLTYHEYEDKVDRQLIEQRLNALGFQLLEDRNKLIVKEVKKLVEEIYSGEFDFPYSFRFSKAISDRLHTDYDTISATFSAEEKTTIEKYLLNYRIEKAKELLVYSPKSISDISYCLGFNSIAHMSRQFKSFTGLTPSHFRLIGATKPSLTNSEEPRIL